MEKGLIVSIQGYSKNTAQELAGKAIESGAVAIRTDQPIIINRPVIGLEKDFRYKYYITPTTEAIIRCQSWSNMIAIDSRKGNDNLELLYAHCHINQLPVIGDIRTIQDAENVIKTCKDQKINAPAFLSTTFGFDIKYIDKLVMIRKLKDITDIPIIAEGGYNDIDEIKGVLTFVNYVCIGTAISDISKLTKKYSEAINVNCSTT